MKYFRGRACVIAGLESELTMLEGMAVHTEAIIRTERLNLEPIGPVHAERLWPLLRDAALYAFIPEMPPPNVEALRARYERWSRRGNVEGDEIWLNYACLLREEQWYVGTVQATVREESGERTTRSRRRALLAYMTIPSAWRRGFAHEACNGLMHVLRDAFDVAVYEARVDTRNEASLGLLRSLGFEQVARIDGADTFKGVVSDEFVFARGAHSLPSLRLEVR